MNRCLCPENLDPFVAAFLKMFNIKVLSASDYFDFQSFKRSISEATFDRMSSLLSSFSGAPPRDKQRGMARQPS